MALVPGKVLGGHHVPSMRDEASWAAPAKGRLAALLPAGIQQRGVTSHRHLSWLSDDEVRAFTLTLTKKKIRWEHYLALLAARAPSLHHLHLPRSLSHLPQAHLQPLITLLLPGGERYLVFAQISVPSLTSLFLPIPSS